tara:strand:+ start:3237 stop:3479 length:243 start_codon:yes stop_codon:yes gene_type:complete
MSSVHHTVEVAYVLVITMWGNTGAEWEYIGNQIVLQQQMTQAQCEYLIDEEMWEASYKNKHYQMMAHCFPEDCAGKSNCE